MRHRAALLLDWEYAAVADPLFDLACMLAYYPQAAAHADALLDSSRLAGLGTAEMLRQRLAVRCWSAISGIARGGSTGPAHAPAEAAPPSSSTAGRGWPRRLAPGSRPRQTSRAPQ